MPIQPGAVEISAKRTSTAKHYQNPDGTYSARFSTGSIHYQATPGGAWLDKKQAFRAGPGTAEWISDESDVTMRTFQVGTGGSAKWWVEFKETLTGKGVQFNVPFQPTVVANDNKLTFSDGVGGTWTYYNSRGGGKMLGPSTATSKGPQSFAIPFALIGGADPLVVQSDGSIQSGSIFKMPRSYMMGADRVQYLGSSWTISGSTLSFTYDDTALPASAYPYRVDPTTQFNVATSGDDLLAIGDSATYPPPAYTSNNTTDTGLEAQRQFFSGNYRITNGLARWDTSSLPDSSAISGASLLVFFTAKTNAADYNLNGDWRVLNGTSADWIQGSLSTAFGPIPDSNWTTSQDYTISLSNAGANISTSGFSGVRITRDTGASNTTPAASDYVIFASYDDATNPEPRLIVDYVLPGPALRSSASGSGTGTTVSPTLPTGWQPSDVVGIAVAFQGGSGVTINTPTGWTLPTNGRVDSTTAISQAVFYRVMQSGDSAPTFTLGSSQKYVWESAASQAGLLGNPAFDQMTGQSNVSSTTVSAATLTPAKANALLLFWGATNTGTTFTAPPTSYTEDQDVQSGALTGGTIAAKTYYFLDAAAASGGDLMDMQDGGTAPTTATMTTGWTVGTNAAPNYADMDRTVAVARTAADATYGWKTTAPTSPVDSTRGNASRIPAVLNGSFASANWTYSWVPRLSSANTVQRGSLRVRLFRGTSATGASATEITAGAAEAGPMTVAASSSSTAAYTVTVNPGALTLTNEYLFFVLAFRITTAGGATTSNILLTVNSGFSVVTSTFTPALDITAELADLNSQPASATGTVSATAGVAAVNIGQLMSLVLVPASDVFYIPPSYMVDFY